MLVLVKFIYSVKATKFCEIFTFLLSYEVPVKSKVKISQSSVAISEYMNFTLIYLIAVDVRINVKGCKSCKINKRGGGNKIGGWDFLEKSGT